MDKRKANESLSVLYVTRTKYIHKKMTFFATKCKRRKYENYIEFLGLAIEALNKQIPKMVEVWNGQASCPRCKKTIREYGRYKETWSH